jgi:hypothetical protein
MNFQTMNNYDFKGKWKLIIPLLDIPKVKSTIRRGIKHYIINYIEPLYDYERLKGRNDTRLPAHWSRGDSYSCEWDNIQSEITDMLINNGIIMSYDDFILKNYGYKTLSEINEEDEDSIYEKYNEYIEPIIEPYIIFEMKKDWKSYCIMGACHSWNSTFCLTLAKLLMPTENWEVVSNHLHTTVVNKSRTKVFDILMYDENAEDFGGDKAYRFATFEGTQEEWDEE